MTAAALTRETRHDGLVYCVAFSPKAKARVKRPFFMLSLPVLQVDCVFAACEPFLDRMFVGVLPFSPRANDSCLSNQSQLELELC